MADEPFDRAEFVTYFRDEAEDLLHRIDVEVLHLEDSARSGSAGPESVNALFRALHTIKGNASMLGFTEIASLAHGLESLCGDLRDGRLTISSQVVDVLLGGRDLLGRLVAGIGSGAEPPPALAEFMERMRTTADSAPVPADAESFEADVERMLAAGPQLRRAAPANVGPRRPTIRVDIERLDHLLNLVGELVVNRTRVSEIAALLARNEETEAGKTLLESVALLARTSGEIQEALMKVRMVPIGRVFERFPRMVRDVAKARGKDVRLDVRGAQTELDKTIVDEIGEPLMHLLRNCVDHGIETAQAREAAGKPRHGTISLDAYHAGNQIVIEISDDGCGIDTDRVRQRALEAGLIAHDGRLGEEELLELIFAPGFSTAREVSEISGRGVGMDVVRKTVTHLKGAFSVSTERGRGTTFVIKLPLTLAIISALLVRVGEELYAIPLDAVLESQRIERTEIRTIGGGEVIVLRDEVVPLIRVAEFFGLDIARDPNRAMTVIVDVQGRRVGLVVDAFEGEQEIVIKPLSDVIGRIAGISGATILGSGAIGLIIDVHALVAAAYASGRVARADLAVSEIG
ncbi:MAG: chemotaxis protein CheA [Candidatus Tyrphobacter sp.]